MVWRAFGDGQLRKAEATAHLRQVQEAVRRSTGEIFTAYITQKTVPSVTEPVAEILPVLLPPNEKPAINDIVLSADDSREPNHPPIYSLTSAGELLCRRGLALV